MAENVLDTLLVQLRAVLERYEQQERELRRALDEVVQAKLMQSGAIRGVEMAVERLAGEKAEG